eukprot:596510-Prymnesium_polylepis.2
MASARACGTGRACQRRRPMWMRSAASCASSCRHGRRARGCGRRRRPHICTQGQEAEHTRRGSGEAHSRAQSAAAWRRTRAPAKGSEGGARIPQQRWRTPPLRAPPP